MADFRTPEIDRFFEGLLTLKNVEEYYSFFEDVCTIREIQEISQRLAVAQLLQEGKIYTEIARLTGASTATISRVNRCLAYGSGGYRTVLGRLDGEKKD